MGATVAIIVEERGQIAAFASYSEEGSGPASRETVSPVPAAVAAAAGPPAYSGPAANFRLGPAARMMLAESGLGREQVCRTYGAPLQRVSPTIRCRATPSCTPTYPLDHPMPPLRPPLLDRPLSSIPPLSPKIAPTGPKGIITKGDVMAAIAAGVKPASSAASRAASASAAAVAPPKATAPPSVAAAAATAAAPNTPAAVPAAGTSHIDTPNSQIRKIIASRLLESKVCGGKCGCSVCSGSAR